MRKLFKLHAVAKILPAHVMELPRMVVVGSGLTRQVGEILGELELGKHSLILSGTLVGELVAKPFATAMSRGGFLSKWEIVGPSTFQEVERISTLAKKLGSDFLIGVGGGRSIDIAKLASFNSKIPFVSVPTSASHDGISSPFGSVKGLDRPYSVVARPPIAIVADTDLIIRAPHNLLASGCGDLISKKTAVKDWELSHVKTGEYYGRYSANLALLSAKMIMEDAEQIAMPDPESISVVVEALISSGV